MKIYIEGKVAEGKFGTVGAAAIAFRFVFLLRTAV
jgi:hypothetical protein